MSLKPNRHRVRRALTCLLAGLALAAPAATQTPPGHVKTWRKLSGSVGSPLEGWIGAGDAFGRSIANIGDLNGDGVADLAVGAPFDDEAGVDAGAVYILHMLADGTIGEVRKITDGTGGVDLQLVGADEFGFALAPCRDFNGDGIGDLLVGAPGAKAAFIVWLSATGAPMLDAWRIDAQGPSDQSNRFGASVVEAIGGEIKGNDWNPPTWDPATTTRILIGSPAEQDHSAVHAVRASLMGGVQYLNVVLGTPTDDFAGTALLDTSAPPISAAHDVLSTIPGGEDIERCDVKWKVDVGNGQVEFFACDNGVPESYGLTAADGPGTAIAYLADFDNPVETHGLIPLYGIGSPGKQSGRGAVLVVPTKKDGVFKDWYFWEYKPGENGFGGPLQDGDAFGSSVATLGDFNSDGMVDFAAGAPGDDDGGADAGAVWLLFLGPPEGVQPTEDFARSLDGRPGRGSVPKSISAGYESVFDDLLIVSPNLDGTTVHASKLVGLPTGDVLFVPTGDFLSGSEPQQAILDQVDGDTDVDILVINRVGGAGDLGTLTYLKGLGDGTFDDDPLTSPGSPQTKDLADVVNSSPVVIGTEQLDAGTFLDAVVGGVDGVSVLFGDGAGGFPGGLTEPVDDITDLALGDLDGDGDVDALVASGAVALGPGNELGFLTMLQNQGGAQGGTPGTLVAGAPFGPSPQKAVASVLLGALDGNPGLDALVVLHELDGGPGTPPQATLQLWVNDGAGGFSLGSWPGVSLPNPDRIHPTYGALGDFDNDADIDAVYLSSDSLAYDADLFAFDSELPDLKLTVLTNQGGVQGGSEGSFVVSSVGTVYGGKGLAPVLADITPYDAGPPETLGDGDLDVILVWYQDLNAGTGSTETAYVTYLAALKGDGQGGFAPVSTNQGGTGNGAGNGDVDNGGPAPGLDGYLGASFDPSALDVLVPNEVDNSLTLLFGVGDGTLIDGSTTIDVDPTLPPGGVSGGPVDARFADLDGDAHIDVVVYSQYDDPTGADATVLGSLVTLLGDGSGAFAAADSVSLPFGGEIAIGDVTGDGQNDVVVTQRLGLGAPHTLLVLPGGGDGSLGAPLAPLTPPVGEALTGGLVLADVSGGAELEAVSSSSDGSGRVVIWPGSGAGLGAATSLDATAAWSEITGLEVVDLTGDGLADIALGERDARLFVMQATGGGAFSPLILSTPVALAGGGPMASGDLTGDGRPDLVVTSDAEPGSATTPNPDQAFVRVVEPSGAPGTMFLEVMGGATSVSDRRGALRPMVADMDANGQPDVVLVHGTADRVSVTLNAVGGFTPFGGGKSGTAGLVPKLAGKGFPFVGKTIDLVVSNALGGANAGLVIGFDQNPGFWVHVDQPLWELLIPFPLGGTPGAAGEGGITLPIPIPNDPSLPLLFEQTGVDLTLQVLLQDRGAGLPAPTKFAATNGLVIEILP
jgi:hypothetical protein